MDFVPTCSKTLPGTSRQENICHTDYYAAVTQAISSRASIIGPSPADVPLPMRAVRQTMLHCYGQI